MVGCMKAWKAWRNARTAENGSGLAPRTPGFSYEGEKNAESGEDVGCKMA